MPQIELGKLAPALGNTCGDYLSQYRARIEDSVRRGEAGVTVARKNAKSLDGLLSALCCACQAASESHGARMALVAVGGYGRGVVGVHSDVDVLFLAEDSHDARVSAIAEGLLYPLWDLGVEIGHAVRSVEETLSLAREDIRTATTLLDLRRVAGDRALVEELHRGARRRIFDPQIGVFLGMLEEDTRRRHERFGASIYLLEPEVKLGRGGLRDMDVAEWAMGARWATRGPDDYVRTGAFLQREAEAFEAAREFFWKVRNLLHLRAGRRQDRLTFEDQEDISEHLGFVDGVTLGVEQFMQAYYRHARVVAQTTDRILARARPRAKVRPSTARDLGNGTMIFAGQMTLRASSELSRDPALALRLYLGAAERGLPVYPYARDAVARAAADPDFGERLRASDEAVRLFRKALLCRRALAGGDAARPSLMAELHEVGVMTAMIPEFEPLVGRVQHDVYHLYTVDVHSVRAVSKLHAVLRGEARDDLPFASRLAAALPRATPLYVALLLHDIGKARGKKHAEKGAEMARPIAERLGLGPVDVDHVVWLIREHLSLYHWATRRDTSDPETILEIANTVGSPDRLRDLYLLTVADVCTTNPKAMTAWKTRMLDDLYLAVVEAFEGGFEGKSRASEIRDEVRVGFVGDANPDVLEAFLVQMPDRYILGTPVDSIRTHARAARDRHKQAVHVALCAGPSEETTELLVIGDDQDGLLAAVTAVLASHGLNVISAEIHTRDRRDGVREVVDVFHVRRGGAGRRPIDDATCAAIAADLRQVIRGAVSTADLLGAIRKPPAWAEPRVPDVRSEVVIDNQLSRHFTVVDVFCRDHVGLLHTIAEAIHSAGFSIAVSKVGTEGARATDVFYVHADGEKVHDAARLVRLRVGVEEAITKLIVDYDERS